MLRIRVATWLGPFIHAPFNVCLVPSLCLVKITLLDFLCDLCLRYNFLLPTGALDNFLSLLWLRLGDDTWLSGVGTNWLLFERSGCGTLRWWLRGSKSRNWPRLLLIVNRSISITILTLSELWALSRLLRGSDRFISTYRTLATFAKIITLTLPVRTRILINSSLLSSSSSITVSSHVLKAILQSWAFGVAGLAHFIFC